MRRKDVHLEKHAAGRLLENAGDRIRREMTVRSLRATDRTRLTDWLLAPVLKRGLRIFFGGRVSLSGSRASPCFGITAVWLLAACSPNPQPSGPILEIPVPTHVPEGVSWEIPAWQGVSEYSVTRSAQIRGDARTPQVQTTGVVAAEKLTVVRSPAGIAASLGFDSAVPGPSASAEFSEGAVSFAADSVVAGQSCDVRLASLRADLADLGASFPRTLRSGMAWRDTVRGGTCISGFYGPLISRRTFRVERDTLLAGTHSVIVTRRDSINAGAEGLLDRHQTAVSADGIADARIYLSQESGQVVLLTKILTLTILARTASRSGSFAERSESTLQLVASRPVAAALPGRGTTPDPSIPRVRLSPRARAP